MFFVRWLLERVFCVHRPEGETDTESKEATPPPSPPPPQPCAICLEANAIDPVNLCSAEHESFCSECWASVVRKTLDASVPGTCPCVYCPSETHGPRRVVVPSQSWKRVVSAEFATLFRHRAASLLYFVCANCHNGCTLDAGFRHAWLNGNPLEAFEAGTETIEDAYQRLIAGGFLPQQSQPLGIPQSTIDEVLDSVRDPERRANLYLRILRDHPSVVTRCCNTRHCFRCQKKTSMCFCDATAATTIADDRDEDQDDQTGQIDILPCPGCGISLAKMGGCNSVTCVCHCTFDWQALLRETRWRHMVADQGGETRT